MRTKTVQKSANKKKINWALPKRTVAQDDFMNAIKEAEKGPFYTVQESMQHFEQWLKKKTVKVSKQFNVDIANIFRV